MRLDRALLAGVLVLGLAGCVTTGPNTPESRLRQTKADKNMDAARIMTQLGQSYMNNGDLKGALEQLNKALKYEPNYEPAHTVMAVVYERINDNANAELHYREALKSNPSNGGANNNLGAFLCKTGRTTEAMPYFAKAVADPFYETPGLAWTNAGVCLARSGDANGAEDDFRKALTINPNDVQALYQMASTLYQSGDAFRASAFVQRYDAQGLATPEALKLGHDIESRLGNKDAALTYRQRLQSQFPDSEQARALQSTASP